MPTVTAPWRDLGRPNADRIGTFWMPLDGVPETSQGARPSGRILQHPPVADPIQNSNLRSSPLSDPAMPGLTARVLVLSGNHDEAWSSRRSRYLLPPMGEYRFGYGAVYSEDASTHGVIKGLGQLSRHPRRHAHRLVEAGSILDPQSQPCGDGLFSSTGCLPDMTGHVIEGVVRGEAPSRVNGPRVKQVRSFTRQSKGEIGTPIVADQVNRFTNRFKLSSQPGHVFVIGRTKAIGQRSAKARRAEGHGVISSQFGDERRPDCCRLGIAINENQGHASERYRASPSPAPYCRIPSGHGRRYQSPPRRYGEGRGQHFSRHRHWASWLISTRGLHWRGQFSVLQPVGGLVRRAPLTIGCGDRLLSVGRRRLSCQMPNYSYRLPGLGGPDDGLPRWTRSNQDEGATLGRYGRGCSRTHAGGMLVIRHFYPHHSEVVDEHHQHFDDAASNYHYRCKFTGGAGKSVCRRHSEQEHLSILHDLRCPGPSLCLRRGLL